MDMVKQFSDEMNTILEGKLPVSRAKMAAITKSALKAVKYYKHIVMTVEKFVSKCAPEFKVPGLYVIDSIVRQSRHQFGTDKDNFGPRFSKSFEKTFLHLFVCPPEDKHRGLISVSMKTEAGLQLCELYLAHHWMEPKIIRVLNLWQKNGVFLPEVIQPLLALAPSPEHSPGALEPPSTKQSVPSQQKEDGGQQQSLDLDSANAIIQRQQSQIQALLQQQALLQNQTSTLLGPALQGLISQAKDNVDIVALLKQTQDLATAQELASTRDLAAAQESAAAQKLAVALRANGDPPPAQMSNNRSISSNRDTHGEFNTALLDDFDYSDDEDDNPKPARDTAMEQDSNEPVKDSTDHLLEELQEQFIRQESARVEQQPQVYPPPPRPSAHPPPPIPPHPYPPPDMPLPPRMSGPPPPIRPPLPPIDYNHRGPPPPSHPPHFPPPHHPQLPAHHPPPPHHAPPSPPFNRRGYRSPPGMRSRRRSPSPMRRHSGSWRDRDREWERERDRRSPWRRSRSPPFRDRNNSRSKTPPHRSPRRRSEDNDRLRKGSGNGIHKDNHVTVLSTTIWMGHLGKSASKDQIIEACSEHGKVHSVDVVQARGCAYVVMETRPDAMKVLNALRDFKLSGSVCKLAWAPGRGVKGGAYRGFWNLDDGVSVIPWEAVASQNELDKFADGGWIDPNTCPPGMTIQEPSRGDVGIPPPFPPPIVPAAPQFPPGMPPPPLPGAHPPMFQPLPPMSGPPPFPMMPPNNVNLPPHPSSDNSTVDMQIASSPPLNSEL